MTSRDARRFFMSGVGLGRLAGAAAIAAAAGGACGQPPASDVLSRPIDLSAAIMQDAAARPSYTAPAEPNFGIAGLDGVSTMRIYGHVQFRYVLNGRDTQVENNDIAQGFGFREVRLGARGALMVKELTYNIQGAFDSGDYRLADAWLRYDLKDAIGEGWAVRFGSFKSPFLYEELASSTKQMLSERSVVGGYFQQGRAQQIELQYKNDDVAAFLSFTDGWRNNVDNRLGDMWGVTARGEWRVLGTWKQHEDMQSWRGEADPMLVLGIAGHIQDGNPANITSSEESNRFLNDTRIGAWTVDAHFEVDGFTLYGAVMGEHAQPPGGGGSRDAIGAMIQAGYFVTDNVQLLGRAEWGDTDGDIGRPTSIESAEDEFAAVTAGVAYYFWANNAKLVCDVVVPLDEVGDVWSSTPRATVTDDAGESGQAALRVMFQWVF